MFTELIGWSIVFFMSEEKESYDDFLITTRPEGSYTAGILQRKIDTNFIMDLYDKYREMPEGEIRDTFKETIKVFEGNIGKYLILTQSKD